MPALKHPLAAATSTGSASAMEKYELLQFVSFFVTTFMLVVLFFAVPHIDENEGKEIIIHRSLWHPNIFCFKEVLVTPTHLASVMEYAVDGELFDRIGNAERFSEDEDSKFATET